jgi:S-adenosylmethionine-diacylglycerol 3-amino-3-carboxypropyl transferase
MSKSYFSKLNYTLANEDTSLELALVDKLKPKKTLTVCGSGGRSLPLAVGTSETLVLGDLSAQQLLLAKHRTATIQELSFHEFLLYWGYPPFEPEENKKARKEIFEKLTLDSATREYFTQVYEELGYQGLIYEGKLEKTFTGVAKFLRKFLGDRYDNIFEFTDLKTQKEFFDKELHRLGWVFLPRMVLRAFGNAAFFNAFLYKGHFVKKNVKETHFEYYQQAYRSLFYQGLTRDNFFLQLTFLGRLRYGRVTVEAREEVFSAMKAKLPKLDVQYMNEDLLAYAEKGEHKFDFVSLSDVPSYFSAHQDNVYLQRLAKGLNPGALVVVRCYLRVPENTDLTGYADVTNDYDHLIKEEKTQIYRTFIYEYKGH